MDEGQETSIVVELFASEEWREEREGAVAVIYGVGAFRVEDKTCVGRVGGEYVFEDAGTEF